MGWADAWDEMRKVWHSSRDLEIASDAEMEGALLGGGDRFFSFPAGRGMSGRGGCSGGIAGARGRCGLGGLNEAWDAGS